MNHVMDQMLIAMLMEFKKEIKMYDKEKEFEKAWTVMNDFGGGNTLHGMEKMEELIERSNEVDIVDDNNEVEDWNEWLDLLKAHRIVFGNMSKLFN
jgi:UDP-glucose 6-dehydrogenase